MFVLSIGLFSFFRAFAGLPSQDPNIAELRKTFTDSQTITKSALELETKFNCIENMAIKDDFNKPEHKDFFIFHDNGLDDFVTNTGSAKPGLLQFRTEGLIGGWRDNTTINRTRYLLVIRKSKNNEVLAEWSVHKDDIKGSARSTMIESTVSSNYKSISYLLCPAPSAFE